MQDQQQLASVKSDVCAIPNTAPLSVGMFVSRMQEHFLPTDAESWDKTGLIVGDPSASLTGVAVALDATVEAVQIARDCGCNVLLTHHPVFLDAPETIMPPADGRLGPQTVVWQAIKSDVALVCFHTALDVSVAASQVLPSMLGLTFESVVDPIDASGTKGYGQLCAPADSAPFTLKQLAARCLAVFGRSPRIYGNEDTVLDTIVTCTGSAADLPHICVERGYTALVCGEVKYHAALDASAAGLCIVELGHDVSELPLCAVLAQAAGAVGVNEAAIRVIDQGHTWWTPEAIRQ